MPVQDDEREREMLQLFNLYVPDDRRRDETDAFLRIDGLELPFELKSSTSNSVSTVRDFGAEHIAKWRDKHWIFGFYDRAGTKLLYCHYASPHDLAPWIAEKAEYVRPDIILAETVPALLDQATVEGILRRLFGEQDVFGSTDAKRIMKNQWSAERYKAAGVLDEGYSLSRMVEMLRERCAYVIARGATLNNPKIPGSLFTGWDKITEDHAATLRTKVRTYLAATSASATDLAT